MLQVLSAEPKHSESPARALGAWGVAAALFFMAAGVMHLVHPAPYRAIIPPRFPSPGALVLLSGIAEIAGGAGLLMPKLRRAAGWGLIALLLAVFPANIYMAVSPDSVPWNIPHWLLWARLPLQIVFIGWVWAVALRSVRRSR